jgi:DNA replication protein DnaC
MTDWQKRNLRLAVTHSKIQDMADAAQQFAKQFAKDDREQNTLLVLSGDSGCGKTHVSRSLYTWARSASGRLGVSTEWFSWPEACDAYAEGFTGTVRDMMDADFLAIDDIGAETDRYKTGQMADKLCQVMERRRHEFTVITTNISPAQWNQRFDIRIADRLMRSSTIIDLTGVPSYAVARILGGDMVQTNFA